jgi:hypothetical protein
MIGTEVAAVFLKRRVQPIMVRAHPMWLYSGPKDETRINIAELSEKELLDEVRRLTHFSQEDSIPLISSHPPFDADHPLMEVNFLLRTLIALFPLINKTVIALTCFVLTDPRSFRKLARPAGRYF